MMANMMTWVGPTLDVLAVVLLAAVLWRLGREPGAAWSEREARLQAIFDELRSLVAQSEGLARDLDGKLAEREERLQALVADAKGAADDRRAAAAPRAAKPEKPLELREEWPASPPATAAETDPATTAARIEALANAGTAIEEIARRLGVPAAEVRLVIGLQTARMARRRAALATQERAHA